MQTGAGPRTQEASTTLYQPDRQGDTGRYQQDRRENARVQSEFGGIRNIEDSAQL